MNPKEQFAIGSARHLGVPACGRGRKRAFTAVSVMKRLEAAFTAWLDQHVEADGPPATDAQQVRESMRAGDVVLVAGRTRMSRFIRFLSGCPWTHVALCIGRPEEYNADPALRDRMARASHGDPKEPVLIEALLGRGTVLTPLSHYRAHAVKICRPKSLSEQQVNRVIRFAVRHLGFDYDLRHILDLMRLAVPLPAFARRWRSTLFDPDYAASRRCICSTLLVQAFTSVAHPVVAVAAPHSHAAYKGLFGGQPAARDAEGLRPVPLFRLSRVSTEIPSGRTGKADPAVATGQGSADTGRRQTAPSWSVFRPGPGAMLRHPDDASSTPRETVRRTIPPMFNRGASGT